MWPRPSRCGSRTTTSSSRRDLDHTTDARLVVQSPSHRHARAWRGHPRLSFLNCSKTWMAGTSPAMTSGYSLPFASAEQKVAGVKARKLHVLQCDHVAGIECDHDIGADLLACVQDRLEVV